MFFPMQNLAKYNILHLRVFLPQSLIFLASLHAREQEKKGSTFAALNTFALAKQLEGKRGAKARLFSQFFLGKKITICTILLAC